MTFRTKSHSSFLLTSSLLTLRNYTPKSILKIIIIIIIIRVREMRAAAVV